MNKYGGMTFYNGDNKEKCFRLFVEKITYNVY